MLIKSTRKKYVPSQIDDDIKLVIKCVKKSKKESDLIPLIQLLIGRIVKLENRIMKLEKRNM